jgi:hypothetical protein
LSVSDQEVQQSAEAGGFVIRGRERGPHVVRFDLLGLAFRDYHRGVVEAGRDRIEHPLAVYDRTRVGDLGLKRRAGTD